MTTLRGRMPEADWEAFALDALGELAWHTVDLRFHALIAAGSGNPVVASILDSIAMPTTRARIWRGLTQQDVYPQTIAEHAAIVDALEMHDPQLAAARAVVHVAGVEDWLRRAKLPNPADALSATTQEPIG